ncbi:uncharacterized protein LOC135837155 [Planococcus citri]|uniref:uncharacterized protein LOC135837155 n=1 Tax=Planococcus citri TaxID=170843 RepID=UPI0031F7C580
MWRDEYLTSLMEQNVTKIKQPRVTSQTIPRIGDKVLVADNLPRAQWRLGKIVNLNISRDNEIRLAALRLSNKQLITRPLNLLHPLKINNCSSTPPSTLPNSHNVADSSHSSTEKPSRKAAEIAKQKITHLYGRELV